MGYFLENQITVSYWYGKYGFVPFLFLIISLLFSILDSIYDFPTISYLFIVLLFIPLFILCLLHLNKKYTLILLQDEIMLSGERILKGEEIKKIELRYGNSIFIYMRHMNFLKKIVHLQVNVSDSELVNKILLEWSNQNNKSYKRIL